MKNKLRKDLFDSRITYFINNDIYMLHKPESEKADVYIEYEIVRKEYDDYCGNDNLSEDYLIQVDIFSKGNYADLEKIIEEVLKEKEYRFSNSVDMYEEDTCLFHCAMRFNYKKIY
ncbi:MAG: prohead protease [Clostridium sp.]|nr:prohead protease [Clostridium sp.]